MREEEKKVYYGLKDSLEHALEKAEELEDTKVKENIQITLKILKRNHEEDQK